ncbi:MAG: DUF3429 domain-containing protein [Janthinobacterium lividum]
MAARPPARVPAAVAVFGGAGLLPAIAAVAGLFVAPAGSPQQFAWVILIFYGALIFSFLGGTWWAFAARGEGSPRAEWLLAAVSPSLVSLVVLVMVLAPGTRPAAAVLLAAGILLSPLVDGMLLSAGLAPAWWMRLRVPLSVGLAGCVALGAWRAPLG